MIDKTGTLTEGRPSVTAVAPAEGFAGDDVLRLAAGVDGRLAGVLATADPVKATTLAALAALRKEGVRVVILTGDNRAMAEAVARRLGILDVEAEAPPERKGSVVERLRREGRVVAMAGDGINDAPAFAHFEAALTRAKPHAPPLPA